MKTIPAMDQIEIEVVENTVYITQTRNFSTQMLKLPVEMVAYFTSLLEQEIEEAKLRSALVPVSEEAAE